MRMTTFRGFLLLALLGALLLTEATVSRTSAAGQPERVPILDVRNGRTPNDTGLDNQTRFTPAAESGLGRPGLKVEFAAGDSIGNKGLPPADWRPFEALELAVFNPAEQAVVLNLNIKHRGTQTYQTRVDVPITIKPGKNDVRLLLDNLKNVNGSSPDFSSVTHWYLADAGKAAPTLFFDDIALARKSSSGGGAELGSGLLKLSGRYRIQGTYDGKEIDVVVTPLDEPTAEASKTSARKIVTDPARLARIQAAEMPKLQQPVMFDTPEADAICSALEVFPPDNAFNEVISDWPLHPNSAAIVESIGSDKPFRYNPDMAFVLVPSTQPKIDVEIGQYKGESDPGPYPVPANMPIEGWPAGFTRNDRYRSLSLLDVQRDRLEMGGDRHAIVVDPHQGMLYEFYAARLTDAGWQAKGAAIFDLKSNNLRPEGWTSTDAAGLPIFPAVVRYDEIKRGIVEHAMRVTVRRSRRAYVHPATHYASRLEDENLPRMGERLRLKADFDITPFSPEVQAILKGLKKYGMLVADNGIEWAISVAPDPRIPDLHSELRKIQGSDFEVVVAPELTE